MFRFVQINDLHVHAGPERPQQDYALANEKARWMVDAINTETFCPLPDFVLGVGDMIHADPYGQSAPACADMPVFLDLLRRLRCPFYPVAGNHDVAGGYQSYQAAFGSQRLNYTWEHKGILFIVVDNALTRYGDTHRLDAPGTYHGWLEDVLRKHPAMPKILASHVPLVSLRDESVLKQSFGFPCHREAPEANAVLAPHAETIVAALSGHLHLTGMVMDHGICHVNLSGPASYPCDWAAVYEIQTERMEVRVLRLPREFVFPPTHALNATGCWSGIHGKRRHGRDFVTRTHPTPEEYQAGRADERRFTLFLPPAKRPKAV